MAVAVLLFQDLAVVPLLIIIPLLAQHSAEGIWQSLGWALGKGIAVILVLLAIGKWVLPTVFKEVAKQRTDELFVLATLMVALLAGGLTYAFGLSMALGAFLAGMMLGESQYRHQLEADIRPFRDILMGLFFTTIGMQLPLAGFASQLHWVLAGLTLMALIKILVIRWLAKQLGEKPINAWGSAIALFQMGEFGFVIVSLAVAQGILAQQYATIMVGIGVFSMAITPSIIQRLDGLLARCFTARSEFPDIEEQVTNQPQPAQAAVICGFGRVGQTVSRFLQAEGIAHIAVDSDPLRVHEAIAGGAPVYYGDSSKRDILKAVGVESAPLVIISFADDLRAIEVLRVIRQLNNEAYVIVRSRDDLRLQQLQEAGASQVVPDTLEASLMLISQILSRSGVPIRRILARLEQERRNHYGDMHGFYPGETTDMAPEKLDKLEFLHAVTLTDNAYAVDKPLLQLGLDERGVAVKALRREGVEIDEPAYQIRLQANDVVLLSGKPQAVEAAENYLLEG